MNAPHAEGPAPVEFEGDEWTSLPLALIAAGDRRLEAECYLTGGYGLRTQIEATGAYSRLGSLADIWQPYRLKGTLVGPTEGLPFFTATQVFDIRPTPRKWVAPTKTPDIDKRFVAPGWILVTCSGSVGDAIMTFGPHSGAVISHDLLRVQPRTAKNRGYLYAFLRSRYGMTMLRSSKYGSIVKHLEPEHVADMPVPALSDASCRYLNTQVDRTYALRDRAFQVATEAEQLYAQQFGSVEVESDTHGFAVAASQMFGGRRRLDAYHYNTGAAAIDATLSAAARCMEPLSTLTERIFLPNRFKRVHIRGGVPFLDSEDVFKLNPEITKFIAPGSKSNLGDYMASAGWLLVARSGQTYGLNGSVMLANRWHEDKVISEHIIRVVPRGIRPGYLTMALGHPHLGRPRLTRLTFGASVPEIAPQDLATVLIPRLSDAVETAIADRVEEASELRRKANETEEIAVQRLEGELDALLHDASPLGMDDRVSIDAEPEDALRALLKTPSTRRRRRAE